MIKPKSLLMSLTLATTLLFTSCVNSISDTDPVEESLCRLEISIGQLTSQIPITISNASTRSALTLQDNAKALTLFAVADDGSVKASVTQASTDASFGSVSMELPQGSYTLVGVAHNGTQAAYASGVISFADGKVTDTFIGSTSVTLTAEAQASTTIILQRRVAKLSITMNDPLPANVKEAKVSMSGYSPKFDTSTSLGTASEQLERTIDLTGRDGQTDITVSVYTFVPSASHTTSLTYTVTDTSGSTLYTHTFTSLSLVECTQTKVYGNFFTTQNVWTIELLGEWKNPIEHNINN